MAAPWEILESWRDALLGKSVARHHTALTCGQQGFPVVAVSRLSIAGQILPLHAVTFERKSGHEGRFRSQTYPRADSPCSRRCLHLPGQGPRPERWVGILQSNGVCGHGSRGSRAYRLVDCGVSAYRSEPRTFWWYSGNSNSNGRLMMTEIARAILKDEEDGFVPVCYTGAVAPSCFCS